MAEKAEVNRNLREIEEGDNGPAAYRRIFYWVSMNMINAYRTLSTGMIEGNHRSTVSDLVNSNSDKIAQGINAGINVVSGTAVVKAGV
jgi:hypothetical protein